VLAALRSLSTQLSGAQLGITVTSLVVGFLAEPSLAALLGPTLAVVGLPEGTSAAVAIGLALVLATFVQMVFGELVPKNLAIARPLPVAKAVAGAQRGFSRVAGPLLSFLNGAANRVVRLLGIGGAGGAALGPRPAGAGVAGASLGSGGGTGRADRGAGHPLAGLR
jgi:CBS domain containing-hemolysin-like protein